MALLYVFGGIGVGLFFMMRRRYVLWRQAAFWGVAVGLLQTLAAVNEFPLLWMTYDTAIPALDVHRAAADDDGRPGSSASPRSSRCRSWPPRR